MIRNTFKAKIYLLFIAAVLAGCSKKSTPAPAPPQLQKGYDHSTAQGKLLSKLSMGSNRNLIGEVDTYFDNTGKLIKTDDLPVQPNTFLLFDDGLTFNPNYMAAANSTKYCPINNNTVSIVKIEDGINYLIYQPDQHETPLSSPSTTIKAEFSLSDDNTSFIIKMPDTKPGTTLMNNVPLKYSKVIRTYKFRSLKL